MESYIELLNVDLIKDSEPGWSLLLMLTKIVHCLFKQINFINIVLTADYHLLLLTKARYNADCAKSNSRTQYRALHINLPEHGQQY